MLVAAFRNRFAKGPKNGFQEIGCVTIVLDSYVPEKKGGFRRIRMLITGFDIRQAIS